MEDGQVAEVEKITLRLYRNDRHHTFISALNTQIHGAILIKIIVSKDVLLNSSASRFFRPMLTGGFAESGKAAVDIQEENPNAMLLWLKLLHGTIITEGNRVMFLSITDLWHAVSITRYYDFDIDLLAVFFNKWFFWMGGSTLEKFNILELRQLLFLTREFKNAHAFAHITRRLAYECDGYIEEHNPSGNWSLRPDHRIIGKFSNKTLFKIHQNLL